MRVAGVLILPLALSMVTPATAQVDGVQVTPVMIELNAERGASSLRIHNRRDREMSFETAILAWAQSEGEDMHEPTADVVVAPSVFAIEPGGEQIVRLALAPTARGAAPEREIAYRLLLRELPPPEGEDGLRVQLQMSLPVFVPPRATRTQLAAQRVVETGEDAKIVVTNTGSAHVRLASMTYGPDETPIERLPRYLLAGQSFSRTAPGAAPSVEITYAPAGAGPLISETISLDAPTAAIRIR